MRDRATQQRAWTTPQSALPIELTERFLDFIDRGEKTTETYRCNLKQFTAWLKYSGTDAPTRDDIKAYRQYLLSEHTCIRLDLKSPEGWSYRTDRAGREIRITCKPNTAAQYMRTVKQFFKWTALEGLYPNIAEEIHAPRVDNSVHKKAALPPESVAEIELDIIRRAEEAEAEAEDNKKQRVREQGKRLRALFLVAVNCGLRTSELARAKIKDLETIGGRSYLYIWGKGHTEPDTRKALAPQVKEALDDYLHSREWIVSQECPLFASTGNRNGGRELNPRTISTMLKKAMKQAGYDSERITAHSLRHTAGTAVQELTGDLYATQHYMRHKSPVTTEIYLHNTTERKEEDIAIQLYNYFHRGADQEE